MEITNDGGFKNVFDSMSISGFLIKVKAEHPNISIRALKLLLPFPTTYLCKAGFSTLVLIKTKQRNRLDVENTIRVSLSNIRQRWDL